MLTSRMDIGGAESHIYTLSTELARLGHEVIAASAGGRYADMLTQRGIRHITLPLDKKTPAALSLSGACISELIDKFAPDVVHSHSRIPSFLCERIRRGGGRPFCFVTTAHMPFRVTPLLRRTSAWGERTVAVSEDVRAYLVREYGIPRGQIRVIPNGIDLSHFHSTSEKRLQTRAALGIPGQATVICSASRSSRSRGAVLLYLCKHARALLREGEVLLLCVSGAVDKEKDLSPELHSLAKEANERMGRRAVIIIEGEADISRYLSASDIFVGVSRAAMEAMASSLPVIVAGNEGYGGIFTPESARTLSGTNLTARGLHARPEALARDIEALRDEDRRTGLGEFCSGYAGEHFSSRCMAEQTLAVYRQKRQNAPAENRTADKNKPVLLFVGHYGAANMGDDASQDIIMKKLGQRYSLSFVCKDPKKCRGRGISRTDVKKIAETAASARAVIFGTGNLLQDDTSLRSLCYYAALFSLCKKKAKKLAVFANGIGPLTRSFSRAAAAHVLRGADYVSMREGVSACCARSLSGRSDVRLGADTVLLSDADEHEYQKIKKAAGLTDGGYYVICPREGGGASDVRALAEFIRRSRSHGLRSVLVPMDAERDGGVCRELSDRTDCTVIDGIGVRALAALIKHARASVCARLHAAVLSAAADTPFVGYDSDGRIGAFCVYLGGGMRLGSGRFDADTLEACVVAECGIHKKHPYKNKTALLRARAEADIRELCRWIES